MTVFLETTHPGRFLISEANGHQSRSVVTVASGAGVLQAGTVLGKITASGKYVASPDTGADGSQTAVAVLLYGVDATSADQAATAIVRLAEVNVNELLYASSVSDSTKKAAKATQLAAVNIFTR